MATRHLIVSDEQLELLVIALYRLESFINSGNAAEVESAHDREEREALKLCIADTLADPDPDPQAVYSYVI